MPVFSRRIFLATLGLGLFQGCGFKLRGRVNLPFKKVFMSGSMTAELRSQLDIWYQINDITLVNELSKADIWIEIGTEQNARQLLTYDKNSQPNAYRLISRVTFRAMNRDGVELVPEGDIYTTRDMDWNISNAPAYETMAAGFFVEMKKDLAAQIMRRLEFVKMTPAPQLNPN
jgi:LPS-assembly lipoprotein